MRKAGDEKSPENIPASQKVEKEKDDYCKEDSDYEETEEFGDSSGSDSDESEVGSQPQLQDRIILQKKVNAVQVHKYGGPEELKLGTVEIVEPTVGQILVELKFAIVTPTDLDLCEGRKTANKTLLFPFVPGFEAAGRVKSIGLGVKDLKIGDNVFYVGKKTKPIGSYSEMLLLRAKDVITFPDPGFDYYKAVALLNAGLFPGFLTHYMFKVKSCHKVLLHSVDGSPLASSLCQWAKLAGAYVIGTCTTKENETTAYDMGCNHVISNEGNFSEAIKRLPRLSEGVDVVFDCQGMTTLEECLRCLKMGGTLVSYIEMTPELRETVFSEEVNRLRRDKSLTLSFPQPSDVFSDKAKVTVVAEKLLQQAKERGWHNGFEIEQYDLSKAAEAHEDRRKTVRLHNRTILLHPAANQVEETMKQG